MKTTRIILPVLLSLLGLSCETPEASEGAYVECIGLWRLAGALPLLRSRVGERCSILLAPTITNPQNVRVGRVADVAKEENLATFVIYYLGKTWVSESGSLKFSEYEFTRAKGTYELLARSNETGETLKFKGPIDFCAYGQRDDCYWVTSPEGLEHPIGLEIDGIVSLDNSDTFASECRVLVNSEKRAVQIDFDLAVVSGINVAHWANTCDQSYAPQTSFQFRMTDFDGPGTYGPLPSQDVIGEQGEYEMPSLRLDFPLLLSHKTCLLSHQRLVVGTTASNSMCTLEVSAADAEQKVEMNLTCDGLSYGGNDSNLIRFDGAVSVNGRCSYREL